MRPLIGGAGKSAEWVWADPDPLGDLGLQRRRPEESPWAGVALGIQVERLTESRDVCFGR